LKVAAYIGGLSGVALLVILLGRADISGILQLVAVAGWGLLWLAPYRLLYFALYALGWRNLLRPYDPQAHAGLGYLLWVTSVREAVDRLLPVASVGGSVVGIRLLHWRGLSVAPATASVIVEILLTVAVLCAFVASGLTLLLFGHGDQQDVHQYHRWLTLSLSCLSIPVIIVASLRFGSVFGRLHGLLGRMIGNSTVLEEGASALDVALRDMLRRWANLCGVGVLQFAAVLSGSVEIWYVSRLCGRPVGLSTAVILESLTQAMRHVAFLVPGGVGVQEATLVMTGRLLGIESELALAISMAKRVRELLCGLPPLISWQWTETRRLRLGRITEHETKAIRLRKEPDDVG
jgi:putative membrane protein